MPNLNKVHLMGNLTRDPELRVTPKGTAICQFSLAINRDWKTESGEKQTEVVFIDIEAWGKQGETIAKYLTKGRPVYVEGRLKLDQWEDKNTREKRSRMKVVLEQFQFLGGRDEGASSAAQAEAAPETPRALRGTAPAPSRPSRGATPTQENLDEDMPF